MKAILLLLVSIVALHGCATPSQMAADSEVRRLCAIDGGIKVYETVRLPADMFNQLGQVNFYKPTQGSNALGPSYTFKHEVQWLTNTNDSSSHGIKMLREYYAVIRAYDGKILGETVLYGRGGGAFPDRGIHQVLVVLPRLSPIVRPYLSRYLSDRCNQRTKGARLG